MHYVCAHYFSPFCDIGCPCYTPKDTTLKFKENTDKGERSNKADEGEGMHEGVHESEGMCEGKGAVDEDEVEDKDDDESEDEDEDEGESKSESEDESESDTNSERECESESESSSSHTDKTSHCTSSSSTSTSTSTSTGSTYSLCTLPTTTIPTPSTTDELLLPIMRYIVEPPAITPKLRKKQHKYLFCFASQHRVFWRIFCDPSFVTYHNFVRGKKDYLHMTCPRDHIVVAAVLHRINLPSLSSSAPPTLNVHGSPCYGGILAGLAQHLLPSGVSSVCPSPRLSSPISTRWTSAERGDSRLEGEA